MPGSEMNAANLAEFPFGDRRHRFGSPRTGRILSLREMPMLGSTVSRLSTRASNQNALAILHDDLNAWESVGLKNETAASRHWIFLQG